MQRFMRLLAMAGVLVAATQLVGCASTMMGQPAASMDNTVKLRDGAAAMAPAAVGTFVLEPGKSAGLDQSVSVRGANTLTSPIGNSFAQYLGETLRVELEAAQLLDQKSSTRITGTLLDSALDAGMSTGTGRLQARFIVKQAEAVKYDRTLTVDAQWESSFMAVVAVPAAMQNYQLMYRKLVGQLFDDPAFRKALAK
ncbi:hypothetical protein [Massilia sp. YMA4]|uniref:hypothetical protein n=1 Tax=Massilia sp. YMA4 TaxID=1593482 RepID=UPI000DD17716|nr:hypothetical protein [Massilia sp. YMA4]AXA90813.1 hypothetical protein DPH57_06305 [Massilia sp. YMA4]